LGLDADNDVNLLDFLLDLLLQVVENIRLLLLVPLALAALAYGGSSLLPKTYESRVIVKGTAQTVSLLNTAQVVDPVIEKLQLQSAQESLEQARQRVQKSVKASFSAKDALVSLTVQGASPEAAQALAQAMTQSLFVNTKPRGSDLVRLETLLKATEGRLSEASLAAKQISQQIMRSDSKADMGLVQGYATLMEAIDALEKKQQDTLKELQGMTESNLLQAATLDRTPVSPRRNFLTVLAALGSGLALLFFVFVRHWLRQGVQNAETASRLDALRRSTRRALGR